MMMIQVQRDGDRICARCVAPSVLEIEGHGNTADEALRAFADHYEYQREALLGAEGLTRYAAIVQEAIEHVEATR